MPSWMVAPVSAGLAQQQWQDGAQQAGLPEAVQPGN